MSENDLPRLVAARILDEGGASGGLYIYDYYPVIYYLTNAKPPTRFVLPEELTHFSASSGVDGTLELKRILSTLPEYIVIASPSRGKPPATFRELLDSSLGQYDVIATFNAKLGLFESAILFRRRM